MLGLRHGCRTRPRHGWVFGLGYMDLSKRLHLCAWTGSVVHLLQLLAHRIVCDRPDDRSLCALDVLQLLSHRHGHLGNIQREASCAARQRPAVAALHFLPLLGRASPSANAWIKGYHVM